MDDERGRFDNRAFWDRRYATDPERGSGLGSRGENLRHKRAILRTLLAEARPATILDVGCGDGEVVPDLDAVVDYRGVDISPIVVESNRVRYPGRTFECADFLAIEDVGAYRADVVLCFEVLIHQHRAEDYRRLLERLVAATKGRGLISGYIADPRPAIDSPIIAWHEPLTRTLSALGATDVEIRGRSLETDCLAFVAFRP